MLTGLNMQNFDSLVDGFSTSDPRM